MGYYRIIAVAGKHHGIFDAITEVAKATSKPYREVIYAMGFESNGDLLGYINNNPYPNFSKTGFVAGRLNQACRELHAPVRIVRPYRTSIWERSKNEY